MILALYIGNDTFSARYIQKVSFKAKQTRSISLNI